VPLVLLTTILYVEAALVWSFVAPWLPWLKPPVEKGTAEPKLVVAVAALCGAYLSVGLSLFSRVGTLSLLPSDFNYYSLRVMIAPAMGLALSTFASVDGMVLVSFVITLLPISDILTWLRSLVARSLNIADSPQEGTDKLINLPGIDSDLAARLQDQGVTTILQLADSDPVQLSMRSGLDFAFIVSLVDEALAWSYFGKRLLGLKEFGWRGVSDVIDAMMSLADDLPPELVQNFIRAQESLDIANAKVVGSRPDDPNYPELISTHTAARQSVNAAKLNLIKYIGSDKEELISEIAKVRDLDLTVAGLRNTMLQIAADGYSKFIWRLMHDIRPTLAVEGEQGSSNRSIVKP
jgi:hypothetical protein